MKPSPITPDYTSFLTDVKSRIQTARLQAGRAVNRELVLLYWDIGQGILEKQQVAGWGESVVERLAADLRAEFPDIRGFSSANIWRMRQFYELNSCAEFLAQVAREMTREDSGGFLSQIMREIEKSGGSLTQKQVLQEGGRDAEEPLQPGISWDRSADEGAGTGRAADFPAPTVHPGTGVRILFRGSAIPSGTG